MAKLLNVSLGWLVGHTDMELDSKMIQRIQLVSKMKPKDQEYVYAMLDAFIKHSMTQNVL
ncbi:MAG: hypothetical protein AAF824_03435 [Bacteroidota bacterium]